VLTAKYPIADVVGHQHIAPDRKTDPGPFFDWQRFQREFLAETLGQFGRASSQCVLRFPE
jgi:N-acetyl-anhydromuramyl-L-alanine amidase AmpD